MSNRFQGRGVLLADDLGGGFQLNDSIADKGGGTGMPWHGLVELSVSVAEWTHIDIDPNGIGSVEKMVGDPARVYRPTAEEPSDTPRP